MRKELSIILPLFAVSLWVGIVFPLVSVTGLSILGFYICYKVYKIDLS